MFFTKKSLRFQACFQGLKTSKNGPKAQGVPEVQKWGPELSKRRHRAFQMAFEEKKHDMLKWMLGCSRGVKMVSRNAEIEDSSKIKL